MKLFCISSGLMCLWSIDQGQMIDIFENVHNKRITSILLADVYHKGPYLLTNDEDAQQKYISNHHFLISTSLNGKVQARGMAISYLSPITGNLEGVSEALDITEHNSPFVQVQLLGHILATFSHDNSIVLWDIQIPERYPKVPKKLPRFLPRATLKGPESMLLMGALWPNKFGFWMKKLVVMTKTGKTQVLQAKHPWTPWTNNRGDYEMTLVTDQTKSVKGM